MDPFASEGFGPEAGPSVSKRGVEKITMTPDSSIRRRSAGYTQWSVARKYAVIVDAGSSGSRMQIYSWKDARVDRAQRERVGEKIKVLPSVEKGTWEESGLDWQLKVEPGLSSFGSHPEDLDEYLQPLFKHASTIIPAEALADTPVYVLATAGMRFLPDDQRKQVISKTCDFIETKTPFSLSRGGCNEHVQVITGEEEGLLGWIAINYLMDGFHFKPTASAEGSVEGTKGKSTFGFLDMGGASTQIAFEPSTHAQDKVDDSDLTPIHLRMLDGTDVTHNVFVTTFLGFGTNKARERYLDALTLNSTAQTQQIADPCLPSGLQLVGTNKTDLMGTGSFDTCLKSLSPLLEKEAECKRPPCLFHGVHVPAIDFSVNHFIGVSEYWFSSNDVFKLGGVYDFVHFQKAAQTFCGKPWSELEAELKSGSVYGPQVHKDRLEMQCFKAAWMTTVLHEGIGLPRIVDSDGKGDGKPHADSAQDKADEKNLFQSVNDVKGLAVSWTLGKAVLEASKEISPVAVIAEGSHSAESELAPETSTNSDHKELGSWSGTSASTWKYPPTASLPGGNGSLSGMAVIALILFTLFMTVFCCFLKGRSPKALKRRNTAKEFFFGSCFKKRPRGDYVLANMEEGSHDMDTLAAHNPAAAAAANVGGDFVVSSDASGEDEVDYPKGSRHKPRRPSGNGLIATLFVPVQKFALAMGLSSPSATTLPIASNKNRLISKRKPPGARIPIRRNFTAPSHSSQPASPSGSMPLMASNSVASASMGTALSRPASRASNSILSPRLHASTPNGNNSGTPNGGSIWVGNASTVEASGGFFAHQLPSSSAASARSSRAASPALGGSVSGRTSRNGHPAGLSRRAWDE